MSEKQDQTKKKKGEKKNSYVVCRDAHKLIVRIVTNIVSDPDEPKFRSINMQGKAFKSISDCQGAIEVLLHLGFKMDQGHLVLPAGNEIAPEALDFLLRIEEIREKEKLERAEREHNAKKASKEAKSKVCGECSFVGGFFFLNFHFPKGNGGKN